MKIDKKKLENIWFYYKVPIIIVTIVLIISLDLFITTKKEPTYDQSVGIVAATFPSENSVENIRLAFENKYNETFEIITFKIDFNSNIINEEEISRLDLDLRNTISSYLIIEDIEGFKKATNRDDWEATLISDIEFLRNKGADNFYLITRK